MIRVRAGGREFQSELFVFDKDGLLFKSMTFWKNLAAARINALAELAGAGLTSGWTKLMGIETDCGPDGIRVTYVNATGCFALASPNEECIVTAGYLAANSERPWNEARALGREIFSLADSSFDLKAALEPRKGFPEIFGRLREANVKYGIATSDNYERTIQSIEIFDDPSKLAFIITPEDVTRGKPDAEMIEQISKTMGVAPRYITMIGDSYVDALMAKNAGAVCVGMPESLEMEEQIKRYTDIIVSDFDEIILG